MKDGIYRVTLTIDGEIVTAEGRVRNGIFQGLGALSGVVGVLSADQPRAADDRCASAAPDHGEIDGMRWERVDLSPCNASPEERERHAALRATIAAMRDHLVDAAVRDADARRASKHLRAMAATGAESLKTAVAALRDSTRAAKQFRIARAARLSGMVGPGARPHRIGGTH